MPRIDLISLRQGYATDWQATNPILAPGEPGVEIETGKMKVGDGIRPWNDLPYTASDGTPGEEGPPGIVLQPNPPTDLDVLWGDTDEDATAGIPGPKGDPGPPGAGVPVGGTLGQQIISTGAGSTLWQDPFAVNVRNYGAKGDGTTDDSAAIMLADAAVANGGTVWFPKGVYRVNGKLTKSPKTIWQGVGNNPHSFDGSCIRFYGEVACIDTDPGTTLDNCRGRIVGMRLVYSGSAGAATTSTGLHFDHVSDQIVEDCYILNFRRCVDIADATSAIYLIRCWIGGAKEDGVHMEDTTDNWLIETQAAGARYGFYAYNTGSVQLVSSRVQGSGEANAYVEQSGYFKMTGGLSDSATLGPAGTRYGLVLKDCQNATVTGVTFDKNGNDHILVENTGTDFTGTLGVTITGNAFHGNGVRIKLTSGVAKSITITANECSSTTYYYARIDPPAAGSLVGLAVVGNVGSALGVLGLQYASDVTVAGNQGMPTVHDGVMIVDGAVICDTPWVQLPGASGDGVQLTASPAGTAGDRCVIARIAPATWTPASIQTFISRYHSTGNQRAWSFSLLSSGALRWTWTTDGTSGTVVNKDSTATIALGAYAPKWVMATHDVDNGASGNDVRFWTSDDGTTWTQLGTTVTTAGVATTIGGTVDIWLSGIVSATSQMFNGRITNASVRTGIGAGGTVGGTEIAAWSSALGTNVYMDAYANQWTLRGNARYGGTMASSLNRPANVTAAAALQNLGLGSTLTVTWTKWTGTQAAYDAIVTKDPDTLYVVT